MKHLSTLTLYEVKMFPPQHRGCTNLHLVVLLDLYVRQVSLISKQTANSQVKSATSLSHFCQGWL